MAKRFLTTVSLLLMALPALAAPHLTEADRQRLADGTSDRDGNLDEQDGFYVLLRSASTWQGDDFAGDAGAAVAPPPDYDYLHANPDRARGNVYLIEGWLAQRDRWPTKDNHNRDKLLRSGDPAWGDQVTRWIVATDKKDPDSTVIVVFNDPRNQMPDPEAESKVRIAARFHKLWTIPSADGRLFTYPVFVGGAAEVVSDGAASGSSGGAPSGGTIVTIALVLVAGGFFVMRVLINRKGGGNMTLQRLEAIRRERELYEDGEDEEEGEAEQLPKDPVAALDVLRQRHEASPEES